MTNATYLTAVLELRSTRRKAAAMERVRATAERVFWAILANQQTTAEAIANEADTKRRHEAWRVVRKRLSAEVTAAAVQAGLAEPVVQGLVRDVKQAIGSYIGLRAGGYLAEWPAPVAASASPYSAGLEQLASATTQDMENTGRDLLAATARVPGPRPLMIARSRDAQLVRTGPNRQIALVLNILRASNPTARTATIHAGIDATTGKILNARRSATRLVMPVACSKWHEQKFLSGRTVLRSSVIRREGERWFMHAQFEFAPATAAVSNAVLGVDRGIANPIALATVNAAGAVRSSPPPAGQEIGKIIHRANERRKREQRRRGLTSHRHAAAVDHQLHLLANRIVATAKQNRATVVMEKLDGLKQTIVAKRPKGARKSGWRKGLKRAQLGKLETILEYKLQLAGLPKLRTVVPGGTSTTCPACGTRDPKSREAQGKFCCTACGFTAHADTVGAVNIARRGVVIREIRRGDKLAPVEQDMVSRLRSRNNGGLGPLSAVAGCGFVAGRATAVGGRLSRLGERRSSVVARLRRQRIELRPCSRRIDPWPSIPSPGVEEGRFLSQV
jgi:putative transposase